MPEYNLLDVYDAAARGERMTAWMPYYGAYIGASAGADGVVITFSVESTDVDAEFDTGELTPHQFLGAVGDFVEDEIKAKTVPEAV